MATSETGRYPLGSEHSFRILGKRAGSMDFFSSLTPVTDFINTADPSHYHPLPQDWFIVVTDVKGSTKAIEQGRYRDVNVLGASSLIAILNALDRRDVPYVFGGDGATIAIPPDVVEKVTESLKTSQRLAKDKFKLALRTGIVPMADIRAGGRDVQVARYQVGPTASMAMFRGGGCAYADTLVKDELGGSKYRVEVTEDERVSANYEGLQCRWDPIVARGGRMLTLLLAARPGGNETVEAIYKEMIRAIDTIVGELKSPAQTEVFEKQLTSSWLRSGSKEAKVATFGKSLGAALRYRFSILFEMFAFRWMFARGTKGEVFDPKKYLSELPKATDFRKFDDTLRMVFECPKDKVERLEIFLETERQRGRIFYGLHKSDEALMTCLVFNYGHHVHLIDGSDGGYTSAAKQFKAQVKA